jgi:hypothetical protein
MVSSILGRITLAIPANVQTYITYLVGFTRYASGFIDLPVAFDAVIWLLNFIIAFLTFRLVLWVIRLARGHSQQVITHGQTK